MSLDPDMIYAALEKAGMDWADKKSAYQVLDDVTKTVFADVYLSWLPQCDTKAEAEQRAYADKAYKEHISAMDRARRAWLHAEVKWKNVNALSELRRSEESTKRAEMNLR